MQADEIELIERRLAVRETGEVGEILVHGGMSPETGTAELVIMREMLDKLPRFD